MNLLELDGSAVKADSKGKRERKHINCPSVSMPECPVFVHVVGRHDIVNLSAKRFLAFMVRVCHGDTTA